jgi:adenylate cyclase
MAAKSGGHNWVLGLFAAFGIGALSGAYFFHIITEQNKDIQAHVLVLLARQKLQYEWTRETFSSANELLRQAIELDPGNAEAHREKAYVNAFGRVFGYLDSPMPPHEVTAQAIKGVELDPADGRAHMVAAIAYFFENPPQLDLFEHEAQQAMELAPYDPQIKAHLGAMIANTGQWQRGVALVKKANELNAEAAVGWYHTTVYLDYYMNGDYESALKVLRENPDYQQSVFYAYMDSIPILGQLGRKREAAENWNKLPVERQSVESFKDWYRTWNFRDEDIAKLIDGVYKSGVLEAEAKPSQ